MSKWIRKGDKVVVISGNDKGKVGDVISRREHRVVVQGVNIRKKHVKRQQKAPGAGIIEMDRAMHVSKMALCNSEGKPVKAKVRFSASGTKELYYLEGEKQVVLRQVKKIS